MKAVVFDHDGTLVDTERTRSLFPGISELVETLDGMGVKLFVWTARNRASTVEFLKTLGIISRFEDLCTANDAPVKPVIDGLESMLEGFDPEDVVLVGDSYTDMIGAKKIGVQALGVCWAHTSLEQKKILQEFGSDHTFNSVSELKDFLIEWSK